MLRGVRIFLFGLLVGVGVTLAITEEKVTLARTDEGIQITCRTPSSQTCRAWPKQIVGYVKRTWQQN